MTKTKRQFGTWSSPVSAESLAGEKRLYDVQWANDETLLWVETRGKHTALVLQEGVNVARDLTPLSVRGRVGYGGGEFHVFGNQIVFSTGDRLYRTGLDRSPAIPLTPSFGGHAAPKISPDGRYVVYVHTYEGRDGLAIVDIGGEQWGRKLLFGTDFVMQPAWHPSSQQIACITWNHPHMPWDHTALHLLTLEKGSDGFPTVAENRLIATDASIYQPEFSPDGRYLTYSSDTSGFRQLYLHDLQTDEVRAITGAESGFETEIAYRDQFDVGAEHGKPAWVQGGRVYGWQNDSRHVMFIRNQEGFYDLWRVDIEQGMTTRIDGLDDYTFLDQLAVNQQNGAVAMIASSSQIPARIISLDKAKEAKNARVHARAMDEYVPFDALADAEPLRWRGEDGDLVYGLYFSPASTRYQSDGKPPLIVYIHVGPTAQASAEYDKRTQYFATRGYGVLHVNYRGSTGYGRVYQDKLRGQWGVADVEDAASGAQYLVDQGRVDSEKLIILGSSAGGFTVFQSLVAKPGFYRAGVSLYGVSNQFLLAQDTHKFEAHYNDTLIGTLPEDASLYRDRSPVFHVDKITDPVIIFQGEDDTVVPKNQADSIVSSLRARGVTHEYHVYEGEGHSFRKPETIAHCHGAILDFLTQVVIYEG